MGSQRELRVAAGRCGGAVVCAAGACGVRMAARHILMSSCTLASANFRPMSRFVSYTVFSGLSAACVLAASPTSRSVSVKATYDGVTRLPWSLTITSTLPAL